MEYWSELYMLSWVFLGVMETDTFVLTCFVGIDKFSSLHHQELTTIMQYIISVTSITISPLIPKPLS